jgi:hypothetical protein
MDYNSHRGKVGYVRGRKGQAYILSFIPDKAVPSMALGFSARLQLPTLLLPCTHEQGPKLPGE